MSTIEIWGHRGCNNDVYFENTIPAFNHALKNFQGLETDCVRSVDGDIFLAHDTWYDGAATHYEIAAKLDSPSQALIGAKRMDESTSKIIQQLHLKNGEKIPGFDDLLDIWEENPSTTLNLELKGEDVVPSILRNLERRGIELSEKIVFSSFAHKALLSLREKAPNAHIGMLYALAHQSKGAMFPWSERADDKDFGYHYTPILENNLNHDLIEKIAPDYFVIEAESYFNKAHHFLNTHYPDKKIILWTYGAQVKAHENETIIKGLKSPDFQDKIHAVIVDYPDEMRAALK